jgi:hypothetical protein
MQIHEITQQKLKEDPTGPLGSFLSGLTNGMTDKYFDENHEVDEGLGSWAGNLAGKVSAGASALGQKLSPGADFRDAKAGAMRQQQIQMLADKSYRAWKGYEKTLLQSNPDAKTDGMYEQALLAFVVKNLLGGQYLPNVINKDKITALVKQLSGSGQAPAQEPPATTPPATTPPATTPPTQKNPAPKKPRTKKAPANAAGAGVFNQMATQLSEVAGALTPQQEKDLWLKLAQQAAVATARAPGTSDGGGGGADNSTAGGAGDAHSYADQLAPKDEAVKSALAAFRTASNSQTGGINVKSTGNPVADALLISAGFRGL